ncbi:MAG: hydrogenase maturation protease [Candidatus Melainabacteria bacterium]|nr:hydrogenase maturation protease [Candidatus Melainabacteria bacterium]
MKDVLVIGCGNLLRGDDGVGPILVRRLFELGIPSRMRLADGGTAGMDVAFAMEGASEVVLVDACRSGGKAGELYELPGEAVETPPLTGINMHAFRFDHAIAFGRWLLKERYPKKVTVFLIEAAQFEPGAPLSEPVAASMEDLARLLLQRYGDASLQAVGSQAGTESIQEQAPEPTREPTQEPTQDLAQAPKQDPSTDSHSETEPEASVEFTGKGYLVIPVHLANRYFPGDSLVALMRDSRLFLLPIRNQASGGLLMKHRNSKGDRSVFIDEVTRGRAIKGVFKAVWHEADAALVVETNV